MISWRTLLLSPQADAACNDRGCQLPAAHNSSTSTGGNARPPALDRSRPKRTAIATFALG